MRQSQKKQIKISEIVIPKYLPLFNDRTHRHIILTSGRAGTKSSYVSIATDFRIMDEKNASCVVLRKHHNKLRKTVYKEMIRGINRLGVSKKRFKIGKSPMEITYKKNGNTIYFSGSDGVDDTKGIIDEDKPIKLVVLDELTEFFDDGEGEEELANIEATFVRGNQGGFQMIYLYNPPKNPNAPINEWCRKMEERPDCIHIHTNYKDVPEDWLGPDLIESAEVMEQADPKMYRWVWLGESTGVDALVYYMVRSELHYYDGLPDEDKKTIGEIGVGVDYGQKNPTVFEAFGVDYSRQALCGLDEWYHCGRDEGQKSPSEYAKELKDFCDRLEKECNRVVSWVFIDPSAAGLIEEVRRIMPHIEVIPAFNDVKLGISRVQKFFSFRRILINRGQKHLIRELGLYQYDPESIKKGKEEVLKVNDHAADATRYLVCGMWGLIAVFLPVSDRE